MATVTVRLSRSYAGRESSFDSVTLREPTYAEIVMEGRGFPRELQPAEGGKSAVVITYYDVIDSYLQILCPIYEDLSRLAAADSRKLVEAVCGFFLDQVPQTGMPSATPPTSSPSAAA